MVLAAFPSQVVVVVHSTAAAVGACHPTPTDSGSENLQQNMAFLMSLLIAQSDIELNRNLLRLLYQSIKHR